MLSSDAEAMNGGLGGEKLHAVNLYQLYAYLQNGEHHDAWKGSERQEMTARLMCDKRVDVASLISRLQSTRQENHRFDRVRKIGDYLGFLKIFRLNH